MLNNIFLNNYNKIKEDTEDLSKYTLEELKKLLKHTEEIKEEYDNLQLVVKRNGNSLYGTSASEYFSLCDVDIAEDITMGAKHFTIIVDKALNNFLVNWGEFELKIIQEFYPDVKKLIKFTNYVPDTKDDFCVYGDTDSRYCDMGLIYKLMDKELPKDDRELSDFILFFNERFVKKIITETITNECLERNARNGYLKMNHEVSTRKSSFIKKKKYILTLIWKDGKYLPKRKLKFTGIELKKGSMAKRMKKILKKLVEKFLIDDYSIADLRKECLKLMTYIKFRKEKDFIYLVSSVSGLANVTQGDDKIYKSEKTHIQMQIMIAWMNFLEENNLTDKYKHPFDGQKMNYYYCGENSKYKVIGVPDDININTIKELPEPAWNTMIIRLMIKPLLRYILDKEDINLTDCEHFLLGVKQHNF